MTAKGQVRPLLFIANRGEIARRIIRSAKRMKLKTAVAFADQDADMPFVYEADFSVPLKGRSSLDTYLNQKKILAAAQSVGATLLHPGYGFLSENPSFVEALASTEIRFIGPTAKAMRLLGDKVGSRQFLKYSKIPLLPFVESKPGEDPEVVWQRCKNMGFPLLIKPAAGGGGKGMFRVDDRSHFFEALASSQRLAQSTFNDPRIFIERFIQKARHIEVQILRDLHGHCFVFGERECSLQRRHQKVIEEAPCVFLPTTVRERIYAASRELAELADYHNAGTVEWIWDGGQEVYFLEVNARLQVEHPVTEEIYGVDLVELQIRAALGESLKDLSIPAPQGHAIEVRLCAEDPSENFMPSGGTIHKLSYPEEPRVDMGFYEGNIVPGEFDSLLGKFISKAETREAARLKLIDSLKTTVIMGPSTNRSFLLWLLESDIFKSGDLSTKYIDQNPFRPNWVQGLAALKTLATTDDSLTSSHATQSLSQEDEDLDIFSPDVFSPWGAMKVQTMHSHREVFGDKIYFHYFYDDWSIRRPRKSNGSSASNEAESHELRCPLPAKVIKILVAPGATTKRGEPIMVIEAMKMEITLKAPCSGKIVTLNGKEGEMMAVDSIVAEWEVKNEA